MILIYLFLLFGTLVSSTPIIFSPLSLACISRNENLAMQILDSGQCNDLEDSLYYAIEYNMENVAIRMVELGANGEKQTFYYDPPLIEASLKGMEKFIDKLIDKKTNLNLLGRYGWDPLM